MEWQLDAAAAEKDYRLVAESGVKLLTDAVDVEVKDAVDRLAEVGLALREGAAFALMLPQSEVGWADDLSTRLDVLRSVWLRADDAAEVDEVAYGDVGYWTHWWNILHSGDSRAGRPVRVEFAVADDGEFVARDWVGDFDPEIVRYVVSNRLITGRAIIPRDAVDTLAEDVVLVARSIGFEVRVGSVGSHFTLYDGEAAVVREPGCDGRPDGYRLTRHRGVVEPLSELFALHWLAAEPWEEYRKGTQGVLQLLAQGRTDAQIAAELNLSRRTVSRRVAELMRAAGVNSRFQLGYHVAQGIARTR